MFFRVQVGDKLTFAVQFLSLSLSLPVQVCNNPLVGNWATLITMMMTMVKSKRYKNE